MLYQLSHVRVGAQSSSEFARSDTDASRRKGSGRAASKVDAKDEDAVLDRGLGIADDGEILEVGLRLGDEQLTFLTCHGRKRALLHRRGAVAESLQHLLDVEF